MSIFMWLIGAALLIMGLALVYLWFGFHRFYWVKTYGERGHKLASWLISLLPVALLVAYTLYFRTVGLIIIIHLVFFWWLADVVWHFLPFQTKTYVPGILAIAVTAIYLGIGYYLAFHVVETDYALTTAKDLGRESLRIVQISDSHLGTTFDGEGFARHMEKVQAVHPDVVVITGDYVDDDSLREDMLAASESLGRLETTYGVYFAFGNHDKGYFRGRDFDAQELRDALTGNGVVILEDEAVPLGEGVILIGRQDRSEEQRGRGRKSMAELVEGLDMSKYVVVLDHQPNDCANEAAAKVDLVLCGHTHGGQMIPIGSIGRLIGANDMVYGHERRGETDFIVNSGISDWAIPFKTGTVAEFGVIDVSAE